jgi:hypothetical protein
MPRLWRSIHPTYYARHLRNSGPRLLPMALELRFSKIDAANYERGLDVKLPFGITVREDSSCVSVGPHQCRSATIAVSAFRRDRLDAAAWLHDREAGILLNEHIAEDAPTLFALRANLAPSAQSVSTGSTGAWPVPRLDQGPQSPHRRAPGPERKLEQMIRVGPGRIGVFLGLSVGK